MYKIDCRNDILLPIKNDWRQQHTRSVVLKSTLKAAGDCERWVGRPGWVVEHVCDSGGHSPQIIGSSVISAFKNLQIVSNY